MASQWVNEEIKTFKSMGRETQVLCLIVDGEPYASYNPQLGLEECFPEPVRYRVDEDRRLTDVRTEPIAADARKGKDGKPNARLKILSGMLGVNFSDLKQRDVERAQARLRRILAGIVVLFFVFLMLSVQLFFAKEQAQLNEKVAEDAKIQAVNALDSARENERKAKAASALALKNAEEAKTNAAEAEKNAELFREQRDLATTAEAKAVTAAEEARRQEQAAIAARDLAKKNEDLANEQRGIAVKAQAAAEKSFQEAEKERRRATAALSVADFSEASRLIENGQPDVALAYLARSLDWKPDNTAAEARLISVFSEQNFSIPVTSPLSHVDGVNLVQYSPDGKRLLTSDGNQAYIWDLKAGKRVGASMSHRSGITGALYSPDGTTIVTASDDGTLGIWDASTGKARRAPLSHESAVTSIEIGPEGRLVVAGGRDRNAIIWDIEAGTKQAVLPQTGIIWAVAFSPVGNRVLVTAENGANLYDSASGARVGVPLAHDGGVFAAAFSADGFYVATGSGDSTARIWSSESGLPLSAPLKHDDAVNSVHFSPDGVHLLKTSKDSTARLWKIPTGEAVGEPVRHSLPVVHGAFSPNGLWFATASADRSARVFETFGMKEVIQPLRFSDEVNMVSFSANGHDLAVASADGTAQVWTCLAGSPFSSPISHGAFRIQHAAFSPDGSLVATASADRTARVWDVGTGEPVTPPLQHNRPVNFVTFSADGKNLVSAAEDGVVQIWDVGTGESIGAQLRHSGLVNQVSFSPDGNWILTSSQDRSANVWNAKTGESRFSKPIRSSGRIRWASWSADGSRIVTASEDRSAQVWNAETGAAIGAPMNHTSAVLHADFSRDGNYIVTASQDRTAVIWDVASGAPIGEPLRHDASVTWAGFSPDGKLVVTVSDDRTARAWMAKTGQSAAEPMLHGGAVKEASFSPDGQLLVTVSRENVARVWETSSWKLARDPLHHERVIYSAEFSDDSSFIVTTSEDNTAKIWQIAVAGDAPKWLLSLVETVGGYQLGEAGGAALVTDPYQRILNVREELAKADAKKAYPRWAQWFLGNRSTRRVAPYSDVTVSEFIKARVTAGDTKALGSALRLQPDNGLALAQLGALSQDTGLADFYSGLGARYEPENPDVLWIRAAIMQANNDYGGAYTVMQKAYGLDPMAVDNFGPDGSEFQFTNAGQGSSSGWLPNGWSDNNRESGYTIAYSQLSDPPVGGATAIRLSLTGATRGRIAVSGAKFIAPQQARMVIQGYIRGKVGSTVSVEARSFTGRSEVYSSPSNIRLSAEWKPFSISVNPKKDIAAQVFINVSAFGDTEIDFSGVVVKPQ